MPKYTLRYFVNKGKGEIIRLLFHLKGEDFEDKRYDGDTWPAEKPNTPFGQIPVLTIDGKDYTESVAIARYLASEFGFYGSSNQERYEIDQVIYICNDLFTSYAKTFFEPDEDKKAQMEKDMKEIAIPRYLGNIEKLMAAKGTGYCVGNKLTMGDLAIFDIVDGHVDDEDLAKYPNVKAIADNVRSNDNIKAYLANRTPRPI